MGITRKVELTVMIDGRRQRLEIDVEDTSGDGTVDEAEVRAQAEARATEVVRRNSTSAPGRVEVVSYRIDVNNDRLFAGTGEGARTFTSPLTFDINALPGRPYGASVDTTGLINPPGFLQNVSYTSDGVTGVSGPEALGFMRSLFTSYGVSFDEYMRDPSVINRPENAALKTLLQNERDVNFGSDGHRMLLSVRDDAMAEHRHPTVTAGAAGPNGVGEAGDLTANQILSGTIDFSGLDENDRKCLAEIRRLVALLLGGGDVDFVLAAIMNVFTKMAANGQARAGIMVASAMERIMNQMKTNTDKIAEIQQAGRTGASAGRDTAELTRLTAANQSLQFSLSNLSRVQQGLAELGTEAKEMARNASEHHARQSRYMAWG